MGTGHGSAMTDRRVERSVAVSVLISEWLVSSQAGGLLPHIGVADTRQSISPLNKSQAGRAVHRSSRTHMPNLRASDLEPCPTITTACHGDIPLMCLDDFPDDTQSESSPVWGG